MFDSNRILLLAARILAAQLFLVAGVRKVLGWNGTVALFSTLGLPLPEITAVFVVAIELLGGLALLVGRKDAIAAGVLALFTFGATLIAHRFWSADSAQFAGQLSQFIKNMAIIGGLLMFVVLARQAPAQTRGG